MSSVLTGAPTRQWPTHSHSLGLNQGVCCGFGGGFAFPLRSIVIKVLLSPQGRTTGQFFLLFWHVCTFISTSVFGCICGSVWKPEVDLSMSSQALSTLFVDRPFHFSLEHIDLARLNGQ